MTTTQRGWMTAAAALLLVAVASCAWAADQPAPGEKEVTLTGSFVCNGTCLEDDKPEDHVPVLIAVDGPPEVAARVKDILDKNWPDKGLDAEAAAKVDELFRSQLKYFIDVPNSAPLPADLNKKYGLKQHYCHAAAPTRITGAAYEKDGKKWIKVSKYEVLGYSRIKYPEKFLLPDKPFVMPDKTPLALKINDTLTLNCIKLPPGKMYAGEPAYVGTRYLEQFPRMCTLTKSYYLSEIPITQEIWEAVMGSNPSKTKGPQIPLENPSVADLDKFLKLLSEKTGKQVRLPTGAEWEWAARSGTSNPGFPEKYADQAVFKGGKIQAVKSKKPNAWGFYDLFTGWWEITGDRQKYPSHHAETDPAYPVGSDGKHMLLGVTGENWTITLREFEAYSGYTSKKFRIALDAEPAKDAPKGN